MCPHLLSTMEHFVSPCFTQAGEYKPKGGILCHGWEITGWEPDWGDVRGGMRRGGGGGGAPDTAFYMRAMASCNYISQMILNNVLSLNNSELMEDPNALKACREILISRQNDEDVLTLVTRLFKFVISGATLVVNFVIPMEIIGERWRTLCGCAGLWQLGSISFSGLAYLIPNWRHLSLATALISAPLLLQFVYASFSLSTRHYIVHGRIRGVPGGQDDPPLWPTL